MNVTWSILIAFGCSTCAAVVGWLLCARRTAAPYKVTISQITTIHEAERATHREQITAEQVRVAQLDATLQAERTAHQQQIETAQRDEQRQREAFVSLSQQALDQNSERFLQLANERLERHQHTAQNDLERRKQEIGALIEPLATALGQQQQRLTEMERDRQQTYGTIDGLLREMKDNQQQLRTETAGLVTALRRPQVRGRWGELQLRRAVELAGMSHHCDFIEQQTTNDGDGGRIRPDLQVLLPNKRRIVVDSKVPLEAYLDAQEAHDDGARNERLKAHARQVRKHVDDMHRRDYQSVIDGSYPFIVLFIPSEAFYNAALEHDGDLLEYAAAKNVILANPATLIALLKAVAHGWREARLAEDAAQIKRAGEKVFKALSILTSNIASLGKGLERAVTDYNKVIGTLEVTVLSSTRRLHELEISDTPTVEPPTIDLCVRPVSRAELLVADSVHEAVPISGARATTI